MNKKILPLCMILFLSCQVFAEIMGGETIEWLSCKSDVILVGKIEKVNILRDTNLRC